MELNRGFQQTDVGAIPNDWAIVRVGSLLRDGPSNGWSGRISERESGTPTLSLAATTPGRLVLNDQTIKYLEAQNVKRQLLLRHGDVLVQRSNTAELVGTTAVFDGPSGVFAYPDLMMRMRFREPVTGRWFWRYANSAAGRRHFKRIAAGSTGSMPKVSGANLRDMPIPLPSIRERTVIAAALDDSDALIESLEHVLRKKREIKQGALERLLNGKSRLAGFQRSTKFKFSEAGQIPEDWTTERIETFAEVGTGARNTEDRVEDGLYPFFVRSQTIERINSYSFDEESVLTAGDGVGTGKVFHYINGKGDIHQRVYRISKFQQQVNGYFFYLQFRSNFYGRVMQMTAKSSVDSVRREMIAGMPIPMPAREEQDAIASTLADMEREEEMVTARIEKVREMKQGMVQNLLTGRIRLVDAKTANDLQLVQSA